MPWLFVLGVLVCAILFPRFRKLLIILGAVLVALIAYFLISQEIEDSESKNRISRGEVELVDLSLARSGSSYDLKGRVRNRSSQYTLY